MPKGRQILTDVPKDQVDEIVKEFKDEGASVTVTEQKDGKFTITAVFPAAQTGQKAATPTGSDKKDTAPATGKSDSGHAPPSSTASDKSKATPKPAHIATTGKSLKKNGIPWTAIIEGNDIVVRKVKVTAFGGGHDPGDPSGHTESGVMNDGSNPNLMGCALPIKANEAATKNSPLAFTPPIPWHTKVRFWNGNDETKAIETDLIDNGPDVLHYPDHAGDLTVAAAKKFAPTIPIEDMAIDFEETLSFRIINGANFIPK